MPMEPTGNGEADAQAAMRRQFEDMIAGLDAAGLGALAGQLMALGSAPGPAALQPRPRPNRRRPRRADEVTYRVRIDLKDAKPPIWRRLELSSAMFLDQVHDVIQTAFGWTDSHLHRFAVGASVWDRDAELYLCPFDAEEGEDDGTAEQEVRLDEVLVDVGDRLLYVYDYGDGWEHVLRLEAVLDRGADAARAVCTGGRRAGPPEDCGGVWGYDELVAADEVDPEEFDLEEVNEELAAAVRHFGQAAASGPVAALLLQLGRHPVGDELADLLGDAGLDEPVQIAPDDAALMVRRYAWLLDRVGDEGIRLSAAGYLPPAQVEAAVVELGLADDWIGKGNRENLTLPVLELRESAQKMGLLRKHRGQLLLTQQARKVRDDPVGLWWHIVARLPLHESASIEHHAGVVSLLGVAAGRDVDGKDFRSLRNGVLGAVGWRMANGEPLNPGSDAGAAGVTMRILDAVGAFTRGEDPWRRGRPTPGGRALARAILQREP